MLSTSTLAQAYSGQGNPHFPTTLPVQPEEPYSISSPVYRGWQKCFLTAIPPTCMVELLPSLLGPGPCGKRPRRFTTIALHHMWGVLSSCMTTAAYFGGATALFTSNTAGAQGGALVSLISSTVTMEGDTVFADNFATVDGGAAYIYLS